MRKCDKEEMASISYLVSLKCLFTQGLLNNRHQLLFPYMKDREESVLVRTLFGLVSLCLINIQPFTLEGAIFVNEKRHSDLAIRSNLHLVLRYFNPKEHSPSQ